MKIAFYIALFFMAGCEYIEPTYFEVKDIDGQTLTLRCFVVDPHRSKLTYIIEHSGCSVVEIKNPDIAK